MCTRFFLLQADYRAAMARLGIPAPADFLSRYNIPPGSALPAVRRKPRATQREATTLRWGLVPAWSKTDEGPGHVNARSETLAEKPSFRDAIATRRCIIPASGFYEWEHRGRARIPWLFRRRDEQPFGFAALWETWRPPEGPALESCAVVTTTPNDLMRPIHHRMPVLLPAAQWDAWLDPQATTLADLAPLLRPPPSADLTACTVHRRVGNVRHDAPDCLIPTAPGDDSDDDQFSLGLG